METDLSLLNQEQLEAVTTTEGIVRVIAGAGSGKTRALTHRFAYLINEMGVLPGSILCVTFTNKAANEMRRRIHNLTGDNDTGYINTFHGFCVTVLQEESYAVQYPKSFLVLDNSDIDAMLRIIYEERSLSLRDMTFSAARDMIEIEKLFHRPDYYKDMLELSIDALKEKYDLAESARDIIFYGYLYQEKKCFGLDYNDLIIFTLHVFHEREEIRHKWQERLEYIMIDEFQDIDSIQYELMKVLCGYHGNLFIVGDPDQIIYTWRGADVKYLLNFDREFPGTKTILMNRNYRSSPEILSVANALIAHNADRIEKSLVAVRPTGKIPLCAYCHSAEEEGVFIAKQAKELIEHGVPSEDIAVLYRAHYVTRSLEDAFLKEKLPYTIYSGVQFFARAEIKDALSYLRMIAYQDDLSFRRVANLPKRNLGQRRMRYLEETAERENTSLYAALCAHREEEIFRGTKASAFIRLIERFREEAVDRPISETLTAILGDSGYESMLRTEGGQDRLDNLAELKQAIYEYETTCGEEAELTHYLSHVALMTNADTAESKGRIRLMTVHAAKGLEFKNVFLTGMNEGIFPSSRTRTLPAMEEERRLAFVAVTRAEDRLYFTEAEGRLLDGSPRYPSRFLLEVDPKLMECPVEPRADLIADARIFIESSSRRLAGADTLEHLGEGTRVSHKILGAGTILSVDTEKNAYLIRFDAVETPRRIAFQAKIEVMNS